MGVVRQGLSAEHTLSAQIDNIKADLPGRSWKPPSPILCLELSDLFFHLCETVSGTPDHWVICVGYLMAVNIVLGN